MATAIRRRKARSVAAVLVVALIAAGLFYRTTIAGYSRTGAAFGARTACACRYVAGRPLADCKKDFEPGMQVVFLSDDVDEKSVTAYVPLLASETARFKPGYGCLLDPWKT
jgi:hypothetical protein